MDRDTLEALVRTHQAETYRYARYLGADRVTAEDVVQDTFLAAAKSSSVPDMGNNQRRSAWLRGVARNVFLTHCRRSKASPVKVDSDYLKKAESVWASEFLRGGDGFEYVEALRKCLDDLSKKERRVVDLRYARKKARSEMAALFNMTEDGIKSLVRRIRTALADCINRRVRSAEA